jgi:hypothetical protein
MSFLVSFAVRLLRFLFFFILSLFIVLLYDCKYNRGFTYSLPIFVKSIYLNVETGRAPSPHTEHAPSLHTKLYPIYILEFLSYDKVQVTTATFTIRSIIRLGLWFRQR